MAVPIKDIAETSEGKQMHPELVQRSAGMVWGANSPSVRKHKTKDTSGFGDFGKYMAEKKRKLSLQFQAEASNKKSSTVATTEFGSMSCNAARTTETIVVNADMPCTDLTKLFDGFSIFVDGFTTPSHQELRDLMLKHGGGFENYFSRDLVTHIICTTLPDSKIRDHRSFSRGLPIVKPSWVVDSISSGRVLPTSLYSHERIARSHPNQRTLSEFLDCTKEDTRKPSDYTGTLPVSEPSICSGEEVPFESKQCRYHTDVVLGMGHSSCGFACKPEEEPEFDSKNLVTRALEEKSLGSFSENVRSHCALGDANFVKNFFKNSRLHFIGTWRTRYQNRFNSSRVEKDQHLEKSDNEDRIVMHVDMDCFFVSVVVRNRPELIGKPVAVCHSEKTKGTAEISSSNYAARVFGVRSGMFIRDAKVLCPELEVVPYDFEGYEQVADKFYDILHRHCKKVQAVSCDEAYLDVTVAEGPEVLASHIRKEVLDLTRCTASVGIAGNLLLARMATRKAKPDGQFRIYPHHVQEFLSNLSIEDLPGVGWSLQERLHSKAIYNCKQLRAVSKETLKRDYGVKTGDMLWCYARGIDNRQVLNYQERKSIGAEVNWGVRFCSASDAQHFLTTLCQEVSARLQTALVAGRTFTLKVKKRKEGAGEPEKFMGCGSCDNLSKSNTLGCATNDVDVILRVSKQVFASFHLDVREIRGMGLQVTRLESKTALSTDEALHHQKALEGCLQPFIKGSPQKSLVDAENLSKREYLSSMDDATPWGLDKSKRREKKGIQSLGKVRKGPFYGCKQPSFGNGKEKQILSSWPLYSDLDYSVLASLPPDIIAELDAVYNGAVTQCLSPQMLQGLPATSCVVERPPVEVREPAPQEVDAISVHSQKEECSRALHNGILIPRTDSSHMAKGPCAPYKGGAQVNSELNAPFSLSQVDTAILEELPLELRNDILKSLPPHRCNDSDYLSKVRLLRGPGRGELSPSQKLSMASSSSLEALQLNDLWFGDPPKWVLQFHDLQGVGTDILHLLAQTFLDSGCPKSFSSVLLHAMCFGKIMGSELPEDGDDSVAFRCCLELLKQFLLTNISCNLEEVFTTIRVVKRLAREGQFWERISHNIVPSIQETIRDSYGGTLYNRA